MKKIIISLLVIASALQVVAQSFTTEDYKKAAWMTLRFYGGQRSSQKSLEGPNWLIMDHEVSSANQSELTSNKGFKASAYKKGYDFTNDADGSYDLSGGWFDCGDHVKFGQTQFYSAYVVLKGFSEWSAGYNDYYSYDYSGYRAAQDFSWEGGKGTPNGIPDVLDEVKFACEFFIKCARSDDTFYSQIGEGGPDHQNWVSSVAMAALPKNQGGQNDGSRAIVKNPNDCAMPSFCAATLALFSRVYKKYDPDFAATCLQHAKYAYSYASSHEGGAVGASGFYDPHVNPYDAYVCAAAELYWATNDNTYKNKALEKSNKVKNHNWQFGYANSDDIAAYNLAKLGDAWGLELLENFVNYYKGKTNSAGVYQTTDGWGTLRYPQNTAFVIALYDTYKKKNTVDNFIYNQVDFVMGNNSAKFSYIVGFTPQGNNYTSFQHPHHRNVYLTDHLSANQQNLNIPTRNAQFGFLGGSSGYDPNTLKNGKTPDYEITEGGIDYNAGLVGALAYIVSKTAPVDTNKFGHPTPDLGPELTLCGTGSATITATVDLSNLKQGEQVTYKWYKGSTLLSQHNGKTSITVTEAGTYTCELVETTGSDWTTSGKVVVSATLPDVAIGDDAELCKVTSATFSTDVAGEGITYAWYKDNKVISGATTNSYTAYSAGTYKLTISASGCSSKSDEATVTSSLPVVVGDTICSAGKVTLSVTSSGDYDWYSVAEEGSALASGSTYSPNITKTTTYYVQDASSINFTAGPKQNSFSSTAVNWGEISATFTTYAALQITSIDVYFQSVYNQGNQAITATLENSSGTKQTFTVNANLSSAGFKTISFENSPIVISTPGSYKLNIKPANAAVGFYEKGPNYTTYQGNQDVIKFTGATNGTASNFPFPGLCNWVINSGSSCARTPVFAVLDPDNPNCAGDTEAPSVPGTITVSNITTNSASVSWGASTDNTAVTGYDVYVNGTKLQSVTTNSINLSDLSDNTEYTIKVRAYDEAGNLSEFNTEKSFTTLKSTVTQSISLSAGWNLISFYVLPEDASITNVFGSNISKVSIVKNNDGFYKPSKADKLQSLTEFEYGQAYLVKANSAFSISVEGVAPTSTTISLKAGWNLLGYPKTTEANASNVLSGIAGKYTELKDLSSSQTSLKPGKGYYIKMNTNASVTIE